MTLEGPDAPSENMPIEDLTVDMECRHVCPFYRHHYQTRNFLGQPCQYTVRVMDVFKGNYLVRELRNLKVIDNYKTMKVLRIAMYMLGSHFHSTS